MSFNGKPKSFVTRQGRITSNQRKALDSFWNRFVISNISEIREHIDNQYTLMDIGFGAGETLISIAQKNKEIRLGKTNFNLSSPSPLVTLCSTQFCFEFIKY